MGKKQKGRRQILQLEEKKKVKKSKPRVKTFIHYSDSDEDSKKSNDSELSVNAAKEACPLDTQVADFFKEIDALTVNDETVDANENILQVENEASKEDKDSTESELNNDEKPVEDILHEAEPEANTEIYCPWQEIKDDSTGYSYYWNVKTNEVTWDCPEEYSAYVNSLNISKNDANTSQHNEDKDESLKTLQKKKESQFKEGSIIPISYYGGSSSSDESLSDDSSSKSDEKSSEKVTKKSERASGNKIKSNKLFDSGKEIVENCFSGSIIGPQLPPGFHFPEDIPETVDIENCPTSSQDSVEESAGSKCCADSPSSSAFVMAPITDTESNFCQDIPESAFENPEIESKSFQNTTTDVDKEAENKSSDSTMQANLETTKSYIFGSRPVVEYDSFTDEEEEVCMSDVPVTKSAVMPPSVEFVKSDSNKDVSENVCTESSVPIINPDITSIEQTSEELVKSAAVPVQKETTTVRAKRKHIDLKELTKDLFSGRKKPKIRDAEFLAKFSVDFDAHIVYQKQCGLGFKDQKEEFCESETSYSNSNNFSKNDYKSVSFVKSDHVLDLNELHTASLGDANKDLSTEDSLNQLSPEKSVSLVSEDAENIVTESSVCDTHNAHSPDTESKEASATISVHSSDSESKETNASISVLSSDTECKEPNTTIPTHSSDTESKEADVAIPVSNTISSFDYEEDIDEIDKALCEALEAKKISDMLSKSSPLSSPSLDEITTESDAVYEITPLNTDMNGSTDRTFDLAGTLVNKLTFMASVHTNIAALNTLLIQLQTRLLDWQGGALNHNFFKDRLQEVNEYITEYENSLVSGNWICEWDSFQKRYYYVNVKTKASQWTYPEDLIAKEEAAINETHSEISTASTNIFSTERGEGPTVSPSILDTQLAPNSPFKIETNEEELHSSSKWLHESSPPPPPPGVDTPPPPPPCSPPPHSPPPPPPDSVEVAYELPEDMDLENSNDSCSQPIISNDIVYEVNQIQYSSMSVCPSNNIENNTVDTSVVTSSLQTSCSDSNVTFEQTFSLASNSSNNDTPALPSESSKILRVDGENQTTVPTSLCSKSDSNIDLCQSSSNLMQPCSSEEIKKKVTTSGPPKKEKKKTKLLSVMALKKKNIPLLVEKWQKIREEQEKEDQIDRS